MKKQNVVVRDADQDLRECVFPVTCFRSVLLTQSVLNWIMARIFVIAELCNIFSL